jgi:hypothetical protein
MLLDSILVRINDLMIIAKTYFLICCTFFAIYLSQN